MTDLKEWDQFVTSHQPTQFCQSGAWSEFQKILGRQYFFVKNDAGQALVIKTSLPGGQSYLFSPRGPLLANGEWPMANGQWRMADSLLEKIRELAKKEKSIFWRFEPPILSKFSENFVTKSSELLITNYQLLRVDDVQPSQTVLLDLSASEEEMLNKMHYKTRYNIRLAEKHRVKIREGRPEEIEKFLALTHQTSLRQDFHPHPDDYYRKLMLLTQQSFENFSVKLMLAEYEGKTLVANLVIFFGDTVTYLHGASGDEYKNLMAPHLLQWETIKMAKRLGFRYYDFWGIDEKKWPGVTRFKRSFAGREIKYPGTFDLIFRPGPYKIYQIIRALNRFKQRLIR